MGQCYGLMLVFMYLVLFVPLRFWLCWPLLCAFAHWCCWRLLPSFPIDNPLSQRRHVHINAVGIKETVIKYWSLCLFVCLLACNNKTPFNINILFEWKLIGHYISQINMCFLKQNLQLVPKFDLMPLPFNFDLVKT